MVHLIASHGLTWAARIMYHENSLDLKWFHGTYVVIQIQKVMLRLQQGICNVRWSAWMSFYDAAFSMME